MALGSGLSAQLGFGDETTVGTAVTVDHFYEFLSESIELTPTNVESNGLRGGTNRFRRGSRRVRTTKTVGGSVSMEIPTNKLGLLLKHMLGSAGTATQISSTAAYKQIHTPGTLTGKSFTVQKGVPQSDGTVKPFTARGGKVPDWTIACGVGEIATIDLGIDAWDLATGTALATQSLPSGLSVFHFAQGTLKVGGTVSTSAGLTSISGGTTVAQITAASIAGSNAMKTDRFYFGSAGIKAEQIENDFSTITGTLTGEFVNQATFYDVFAADTRPALQLTFEGATIEAGNKYTLDIIIPYIAYDGETPKVGGPDVVALSPTFTAEDDGTNPVIQIVYISTDTAI